MSTVLHGGDATKAKKFSFFQLWFTREGRLIRRFNELKKRGARGTPAVIIDGPDQRPIEVTKAPKYPNGFWVLYDGRNVKTSDILELDSARWLAGYSF